MPTNCLSAFALFCELHFVGFALKGLKKYTWSQRTSDAAIRSGKSEERGYQILIKGGTNKQKNATLQKPKVHDELWVIYTIPNFLIIKLRTNRYCKHHFQLHINHTLVLLRLHLVVDLHLFYRNALPLNKKKTRRLHNFYIS